VPRFTSPRCTFCAVAAGVEVPVDLLAHLVLDDPSRRACAALTRRLRALATPPAELVPVLPRLRDHAKRCMEKLRAEAAAAGEELRAAEHRRRAAIADGTTASRPIAMRVEVAQQRGNAQRDLAELLREVDRLSSEGSRGG
jgi:hypothetical protein